MNIRLSIITGLLVIAIIALFIGSCEKPERLFKIRTLDIEESDYSYTEATVKARIVDLGSKPVEDHGFVISQNQNPVIGMNSTAKYFSTKPSRGEYQWKFSGLNPGTTYFFRGFAVIGGSPVYAPEIIEFTTLQTDKPVVTISTSPSVFKDSARVSGEVTNESGLTVTHRGFCWNTSPNPDLGNSLDTTVNGVGLGSFTSRIDGLSPGTSYYFRSYAINSKGVSYSTADLIITTHALPSISTTPADQITNTTARSGGDVTGEGGVPVTSRGVCWSTSNGPTADLPTKTSDGTGTGVFTSSLTGLSEGTKYYIRAYASNQYGTAYGTEHSFTTSVTMLPPSAVTNTASPVGSTTATLRGSVNANGLLTTVTFEYGTTTAYGQTITAAESPASGGTATSVSATITGLSPSTTYHFRVKAESTGGTSYGDDATLSTTAVLPTVTDYDGNVYNIITIGTQEWLQSNLTTEHYNNGEPVLEVTVPSTWGSVVSSAMCYYNNEKATYKAVYGGLYNWYAVTDIRNICPPGWHVPTDAEWTNLTTFLGGESIAGGKLKETGTIHWDSPNTGATNETGFTALPGGARYSDGAYNSFGFIGFWWSATENDINNGWYREIWNNIIQVNRFGGNKRTGFSVRCIKGALPLSATSAATGISSTSVTLNGKVNPNGASTTITFEYGVTTSYGSTVTAIQSPSTGSIPVNVSASLTGLLSGTTYHFRVKAVNTGGTVYGEDLTFSTSAPASPAATTGAASAVASISGTLNGNINANGLSTTVTFEYGTTTSYGNEVAAAQSPAFGTSPTAVSKNITGLTPSNTYHYRVKAVSSGGTTYGDDMTFITPAKVSDGDGNIYNTVIIGSQTWMQENLKTTKYFNGDVIPNITDNGTWGGSTTGAYCWYNNDESTYKNQYGALYNWYTVTDIRNVCPSGWRIPSDAEWTNMENYLIAGGYNYDGTTSGNNIAKALAAAENWTASANLGAVGNTDYPSKRNSTGFTALPGGVRAVNGTFMSVANQGVWWSSIEFPPLSGWERQIFHEYSDVKRDFSNKPWGHSIRCIKGEMPLTVTNAATAVASNSVTFNGRVNPNGASTTVTFEYGTTTSYGTTVTASQSPVMGSVPVTVSFNLTGLTPNTTYHYRVKAVNPGGTSYGADMAFVTPGQVGDVDGNVYNTVIIGTQTWMMENLKTTKYNDGISIPLITDGNTWNSLTTPGYCWYNNDESSWKNIYGAFYNWFTVNTGKLCPGGWHVPTSEEFSTLENYLILNGYNFDGTTTGNKVAKSISSTIGWRNSTITGTVGNSDFSEKRNITGFSARPTGNRNSGSSEFLFSGDYGYLWGSNQSSSSNAWGLGIYYDHISIDRNPDYNKKYGFPVRCIKD